MVIRGGAAMASASRIWRWRVGERGGLLDGAVGPGEGDEVQALQFERDPPPGLAGLAFADADQQQREPADQDVRADAVLEAVKDGSQLERGLEIAEAAFGFEQVLVAERDVFGGEVGVTGGEQVLAVQALLGLDLGAVDQQPSGRGLAQVAPERGVIAQRALGAVVRAVGLGALGLGAGRGDPVEFGLQARDRVLARGLVAFGFGGVVADDEALGRVAFADADFLDSQVLADGLVAALAGERGLGVCGCRRASVRRRSSARPRGSDSAGSHRS